MKAKQVVEILNKECKTDEEKAIKLYHIALEHFGDIFKTRFQHNKNQIRRSSLKSLKAEFIDWVKSIKRIGNYIWLSDSAFSEIADKLLEDLE